MLTFNPPTVNFDAITPDTLDFITRADEVIETNTVRVVENLRAMEIPPYTKETNHPHHNLMADTDKLERDILSDFSFCQRLFGIVRRDSYLNTPDQPDLKEPHPGASTRTSAFGAEFDPRRHHLGRPIYKIGDEPFLFSQIFDWIEAYSVRVKEDSRTEIETTIGQAWFFKYYHKDPNVTRYRRLPWRCGSFLHILLSDADYIEAHFESDEEDGLATLLEIIPLLGSIYPGNESLLIGGEIEEPVLIEMPEPVLREDRLDQQRQMLDHFGNYQTHIRNSDPISYIQILQAARETPSTPTTLTLNDRPVAIHKTPTQTAQYMELLASVLPSLQVGPMENEGSVEQTIVGLVEVASHYQHHGVYTRCLERYGLTDPVFRATKRLLDNAASFDSALMTEILQSEMGPAYQARYGGLVERATHSFNLPRNLGDGHYALLFEQFVSSLTHVNPDWLEPEQGMTIQSIPIDRSDFGFAFKAHVLQAEPSVTIDAVPEEVEPLAYAYTALAVHTCPVPYFEKIKLAGP